MITRNIKPDLVVIQLESPFRQTAKVSPACLPKQPIKAGSLCYTSGWGVIEPTDTKYSDWLRAVEQKILSSEACEDLHHSYYASEQSFLPEYEICVESNGKSPCLGDIGGPLICEGDIS